ncbi:MAG: hypothetical protein J0M12_01465 [Deltaproteobacteria bacterium]|nr:hypothetical protein [Deltaproteobacteria bacterium]
MAIDEMLLKILVCPENKTPVTLAESALIEGLNQRIAQGNLKNRGGSVVKEKIESGLLRADGKYLYPVREDIPIMLVEEAIEIQGESRN